MSGSDTSAARRELLELLLAEEGIEPDGTSTIEPRRSGGAPPLSYSQERMWLLEKLEPGSHYNDSVGVRIRGALDTDALERGIGEVVRRHEVLRTHFEEHDGRPHQVVEPARPIPLQRIDLARHPAEDREAELGRLAMEEIKRPIDLSAGPVIRPTLFRLSGDEFVFLLVIHQAVDDSWSVGVLMDELAALYNAARAGSEPALAPLPIQYADYAVWQKSRFDAGAFRDDLSYWTGRLSHPRTLELPTDRPRPAFQTHVGATHPLAFDTDLVRGLERLARQEQVTSFMLLLAALTVLLGRYSGQDDVTVGIPIANRDRPEIQGLVGMFINTLALRTDISGNPSFRDVLARVRETATGAYTHPHLPFEELLRHLDLERDLSRTPLFQVLLDYKNTPEPSFDFAGLEVERVLLDPGMSRFDLTLDIRDADGELSGHVNYNTDLYDASTIARLGEHLTTLLESVVEDCGQRIRYLRVMPEAERHRLLVEYNDTTATYDGAADLHDLFADRVRRSPDAVALREADGSEISYAELGRRSGRVAGRLTALGVVPGEIVAICAERSAASVAGILGILEAGAVYLPLDPSHPPQRLRHALEDSGARVVLTDGREHPHPGGDGVVQLPLEGAGEAIAAPEPTAPAAAAPDRDAAYVIYPSGSSDHPRGVLGSHRATVNRLTWTWNDYPYGADEVCCQMAPIGSVDAVAEILGPLLGGATLAIIADEALSDPAGLVEAMAAHGVTRTALLPSQLRSLLEGVEDVAERLPRLRQIACSGETLPPELAERALGAFDGLTLSNLYGSSEVSGAVTSYRVPGSPESSSVPIGRPISNARVYVLDDFLRPVPTGVHGELYVGGDCLALGYLNSPELTDERFLPDPHSSGRVFRTGDVARFLPDGNVELLGRRDERGKGGGARLELGELERELEAHADVAEAVAVVREDRPGDPRLVAYTVVEPGRLVTPTELRRHLRASLPDHMIPQIFVEVDELPLNRSGKVDRRALPAPFMPGAPVAAESVAPRSAAEIEIASIWEQVLGVERVGIHDNFFDLGGHSLLAATAISRIEQNLGTSLTLRSLVLDTLEQVAALCAPAPATRA